MHMHLAVSAANDVDIAGYIAQFETHRAGNIKRAVETAGDGGTHLAAGEGYDDR
jgi:hypothetical protein